MYIQGTRIESASVQQQHDTSDGTQERACRRWVVSQRKPSKRTGRKKYPLISLSLNSSTSVSLSLSVMSDSSTDKLKQAAELIRKRKAEQAAKGESPLKKAKVLHTGPYLLVKQVKNLCLLATNKPLPKQSGIKQITGLFSTSSFFFTLPPLARLMSLLH